MLHTNVSADDGDPTEGSVGGEFEFGSASSLAFLTIIMAAAAATWLGYKTLLLLATALPLDSTRRPKSNAADECALRLKVFVHTA